MAKADGSSLNVSTAADALLSQQEDLNTLRFSTTRRANELMRMGGTDVDYDDFDWHVAVFLVNVGSIVTLVGWGLHTQFEFIDDWGIAFIVTVSVYFIICCSGHTMRANCHLHNVTSVEEAFESATAVRPKITMHIECYHTETRTRTVRDSEGNTRTETYTVKVVTHRASGEKYFGDWQNVSGDPPTMEGIDEKYLALRLKVKEKLEIANDETRLDLKQQGDAFFARHRSDVSQRYWEDEDVCGNYMPSRLLVFRNQGISFNRFTWGTNLLLTLLLLGWPYRIYVEWMTCRGKMTVIKVVSSTSQGLAQLRANLEEYSRAPVAVIYEEADLVEPGPSQRSLDSS